MKKIDYNLIIKNILFLIITLILKFRYIFSLAESNNYCDILVYWGDNLIVNLIWLLPIIFLTYQLTKKFVCGAINFNTRYVNRKCYIRHLLIINFIYCLIFSVLFSLAQIIIFIKFNNISFTFDMLISIIRYFMMNYLLNLWVLFLSFFIRKYIYSLVIITIFFCLVLIIFNSLILSTNLLFCAILCIILNIAIRKKYFVIDLGGVLK